MKFLRHENSALAVWMATVISLLCLLVALPAKLEAAQTDEKEKILIGLDAAMTGVMAQSGTVIKRGALLAIEELNQAGGVLGRKLELTIKNHRGVPARGVDNIHDLARKKSLVAILGGLHTPVALAELKAIHKHKLIYVGPWAADTPIVENGNKPNYVFRVSAHDELAGGFLIKKALERGSRKPGLQLWRTGWGRLNHKATTAAMTKLNFSPAGLQWFNSSQRDISVEIEQLKKASADVIMLIANAHEGSTLIKNMAARLAATRIPIITHWGITGAEIVKKDQIAFEKVDLTFLQSFSFFKPTAPEKAAKLVKAYCNQFNVCGSVSNIVSPVGTAHAYDPVHILKRAIEAAGTIERDKVRSALEGLGRYDGLVRTYNPPFTPQRHDALDVTDFRLCEYDTSGAILPMNTSVIR